MLYFLCYIFSLLVPRLCLWNFWYEVYFYILYGETFRLEPRPLTDPHPTPLFSNFQNSPVHDSPIYTSYSADKFEIAM